MAEAWARKNGFILDDRLKLADRAVSAYRRANLKKGAELGKFLNLVKSGHIAKGSTLIIENLDRLSRADIWAALDVFREIVLSGIRLVSLSDGMEYTEESIKKNPYELMVSIGSFTRGNHESVVKSDRVRHTFDGFRKNLDKRKWPTGVPKWLKLDKEKKVFTIVGEKRAIIQRIFTDYDRGKSTSTIVKELNDEKVPRPYDNVPEWHVSTVADYLQSRNLIGEFQPCQLRDGKKVPFGPPIENYYPPIIDRELFFRVNAKLAAKRKVRGRKCEGLVNIFRGMLHCPYCGGKMMLNRQIHARCVSDNFICDHAHHYGKTCLRYSWPRRDFETCFLEYAKEVHAEYVKFQPRDTGDRAADIARISNELADVAKRLERLYPLFEKDEIDLPSLTARSTQLKAEKAQLEKQLNAARAIQSPRETEFDLNRFLDTDLDNPENREQIADVISRIFSHIDVYFVGPPSLYKALQRQKAKCKAQGMTGTQIFCQLTRTTGFAKEHFFIGYLKNGMTKMYPDLLNDPVFSDMLPQADYDELAKRVSSTK